ncbi:MAG: hypothetical protein NT163_07435 [Chlorobiales bacterium]|nr:hypothetical protein [Chlorobiales bacterium]
MAKTAKGVKRKFETSVALWMDLLGYGSMLQTAGWDPTSDIAKASIDRIINFHQVVSKRSMRNFPTFVMNDGAIAFRDLSPRSNGVTFDFLRRAIDIHAEVNQIDFRSGYYGARAVLAVGFRVRSKVDYAKRQLTGEGRNIKDKIANGLIQTEQAINQALSARHHSDSTP